MTASRPVGVMKGVVEGDAHPPPRPDANDLLDERHGKNRDGKQNRDERFGVAGKIEVPHGIRPFKSVRRNTRGGSLLCHFSVEGSALAT